MARHRGRLVVLHLAAQYPFAGIFWQLIHHLVGLRRLGFDVYYIEDHGAWTYDPIAQTPTADPGPNLRTLAHVLGRFGFGDRWAFYDYQRNRYLGMERERCHALLAEADAVINLCCATEPREEHQRCRCLIYLQTDPGVAQVRLAAGEPEMTANVHAHHLHFTYAENIGAPDCALPTGGIEWRPTRPPVLTDEWSQAGEMDAAGPFSTVCTWHNAGKDVLLEDQVMYWSKDVTFRQFADVPRRCGETLELATDLDSGRDYEKLRAGGFRIIPAVPMSLDLNTYRQYLSCSRGEFTTAKDVVVRTNSGWFSDRSVCYLAAGRPVVTQSTGFERYLPTGRGLFGFSEPQGAAEAIKTITADYNRHSRAARAIATDFFDSSKVLAEVVGAAGL